MTSLYVSGPITGMPDDNRGAFEDAAHRLAEAGYRVVAPLGLVPDGTDWESAMRACVREMVGCDGVALLPGHEHSRGATVERTLAEGIGMPVATVAGWLCMARDHVPREEVERLYWPIDELRDDGVDEAEIRRVMDVVLDHHGLDAYVDEFFLPRPTFDDGRPVRFGDRFSDSDGVPHVARQVNLFDDGSFIVADYAGNVALTDGGRLVRPTADKGVEP